MGHILVVLFELHNSKKTWVFRLRFKAYLWLLSYVTQKQPTFVPLSIYSFSMAFELLTQKNTCVPYSIYSLYMAFELLTQKTGVSHIRFTASVWVLSYVTHKNTCIPCSIYSLPMTFELRNSKTTNVCPIIDLQLLYGFWVTN